MSKNTIITIIVIVIVLAGGLLWYKSAKAPESQTAPAAGTNETAPNQTGSQTGATGEATVVYSENGFSPKTLTVKKGVAVTFKNQADKEMWVASAMHPEHKAYSGTSLAEHCPDLSNAAFDACQGYKKGESWSFKFDKTGDWKYHNHLDASEFGAVIVTE